MSIVMENLCKRFDGKTVLHQFTWTVDRPMVLMGPSGCGKTTLLRILLGLLAPDAGEVRTGGARIGAVFQEDRLIEHMTALQNLALVAGKASRAQLKEHLALLGLEAEAEKRVSAFSGGMRRRVAIVRALLAEWDVLFLHEPFTGLDGETKAAVLNFVRRSLRGRTALLVTHDRAEAEALGAAQFLALP